MIAYVLKRHGTKKRRKKEEGSRRRKRKRRRRGSESHMAQNLPTKEFHTHLSQKTSFGISLTRNYEVSLNKQELLF